MTIRPLLPLLCAGILFSFPLAASGQVSISIDTIVANDRITGTVQGLDAAETAEFKVVVYVRTDQWYIHPYAGQGEGRSWARVKPDGSWSLETVRRQFSADSVAALLVPAGEAVPSRMQDLASVAAVAKIVRRLEGTPEHGRL